MISAHRTVGVFQGIVDENSRAGFLFFGQIYEIDLEGRNIAVL